MLKGEYPFISDVDVNKEKKKLDIKITNSNELNDLFKKLTKSNPEKRISFIDYFNHPFFKVKMNLKMVFLGGSYCGKTCIINKIYFNTFEESIPTVRFDVKVKLYINLYKFRL
jgi:serine/threonine protein kinase